MTSLLRLMLIYLAFVAGLAIANDQTDSTDAWYKLTSSSKSIQLIKYGKTWQDAKNHCEQKYARLLEIENELVQKEVEKFLEQEKSSVSVSRPYLYWIGIKKNGDNYTWASDGEEGSYTNWRHNRPPDTPTCGQIDGGRATLYKWTTERCDQRRKFICEKEQDDPGDDGDGKGGTESEQCVNTSLSKSRNNLTFNMAEMSSATPDKGIFSIEAGAKAVFKCTVRATSTPCLQMFRVNQPQLSYQPSSYQRKGEVVEATFTIQSIDGGHECGMYTCGAHGESDPNNTATQITLCAPFQPKSPPVNLTIIPHDNFIEVYLLFESYPLISSSSLFVDGKKQRWESILDENEMNKRGNLYLNGSSTNSLIYLNLVQLFFSRQKLSQKISYGSALIFRADNDMGMGSTDYNIPIGQTKGGTQPPPRTSSTISPVGEVTSSRSSSDDNNIIYIIVAVIAVVVALLLLITVAIFVYKRSKKSTAKSANNEKKQTPLNPEKDDGRFVSEDGLVYVTVEHAQDSKKKPAVKADVTKSANNEKKQTPLNPEKDNGRFVSEDGLVYVTVEHAKGSKKKPAVKEDVTKSANNEKKQTPLNTEMDDGRFVSEDGLVYATVEHAKDSKKEPAVKADATKSANNEKKQTQLNPEKDDGRFVSEDGLVYVTVEHAQGSKKEPAVKPDVKPTVKPEPRFERVEYVALYFQKSGNMQE